MIIVINSEIIPYVNKVKYLGAWRWTLNLDEKSISYLLKMNELLSDTETYTIVNKDPTKKICSELNTILKKWKQKTILLNGHFMLVIACYRVHMVYQKSIKLIAY